MATRTGLEPAIYSVTGNYVNQLHHRAILFVKEEHYIIIEGKIKVLFFDIFMINSKE